MKTKRRRGHGEGSVYLRSDGRWAGVATLSDGRRKFVYAKTQADAISKLRQVVDARERGLPTSEIHRFRDFAMEWLEFKKSSVRPRTHDRYEQLIRIYLTPKFGHRQLQKITPTDMTTLYAELMTIGLSASTVRHVHVAARTMMQDAMRWGYISRNVVSLAKPPKAERIEMNILDAEQVQDMLRFSDRTPLRSLWRLALGTALRAGELLALRWSDMDLDKEEFTVNHTLRDLKQGKWELTEPKSAKSRRKIGLTKSLAAELVAHRKRQNEQVLGSSEERKDHGFVFARDDGRPFIVSSLKRRYLEPIMNRAGLPIETRVHDLRHTSISHALANGTPIADVSQWAGHASVSITLSLYAHALPEATKRTTESVALALGL